MQGRASFRKPFLATLATLFAVVAIVYGSLWMYAVRHPAPGVELGFNLVNNPRYDDRTHSQSVEDVMEGSPAERSGPAEALECPRALPSPRRCKSSDYSPFLFFWWHSPSCS